MRLYHWLRRESGIRFLLRRKASFLTAVLTMAIALAANTTAFAVVRAFLFTSFGMPDAHRVFSIAPVRDMPGRGEVVFADAYANYRLIRETQNSFADVTVFSQGIASWETDLATLPLQSARVTASFFSTLRVQPARGRAFRAEEEGPNAAPVAIISDGLWRSAFAARDDIIGRSMRIDGVPYTIVGVMPPGFTHPLPTDLWLPFDLASPNAWTSVTGARNLTIFGRLKDAVDVGQARAEADVFTRRAREATRDNDNFRYTLQSFRQIQLPNADRTVLFVQAGATLLLLLAIANLATLLLAWGFDRQQEMSLRLALGAGSARVAGMMVMQALVVVLCGGILGIALTLAALPLIRQLDVSPAMAPFIEQLRLDPLITLATGAAVAAAALVAAAAPAWLATRSSVAQSLRAGSRSASLSPAALRLQKSIVAVQAALSVMILTAAIVIASSFRSIAHVPLGFSPEQRTVARIRLNGDKYAKHEARVELGTRLLTNLANERELTSAAFTTTLPVGDIVWGGRFFTAPDQTDAEPSLFHFRRVSNNYLQAMGIALLGGRQFDDRDQSSAPKVAIVSRSLAQRYWPDEDAVGRRLYRVVNGKPSEEIEIVGVAADVLDAGYNAPAGETVYVPWSQISLPQLSIVATARTEQAALAAVRRAVRRTDAGIALSDTAPLRALVSQAYSLPELQTILLTTFAIVALTIMLLGSYGVMMQLVATREKEFTVRLVFGASPASLAVRVLRQSAALALAGALFGIIGLWLARGVLAPHVFGVQALSAGILAQGSVTVLTLALAAALPAAARARRLDGAAMLR